MEDDEVPLLGDRFVEGLQVVSMFRSEKLKALRIKIDQARPSENGLPG